MLRENAANSKIGLEDETGTSVLNTHLFKCRDTEFDLSLRTHIMGVLNTTPDSFYDGGNYSQIDAALKHVEKMIEEGADIIDIGGESTRPGSLPVSAKEELERVIPVIKEIRKRFDIPLSIDTTKSEVALRALEEGVKIVNDISALTFDPEIADAASKYGAGLVLSHTTSRPRDMQSKTSYGSLIEDIKLPLRISVKLAEHRGVRPRSIVVDPGFGFGKTVEQNLAILKHLNSFLELGKPILIGTSNKSFIGKVLDAEAGDRTEGTAATVAVGILNGASIIRVHETGYMKRVSQMIDAILNVSHETY